MHAAAEVLSPGNGKADTATMRADDAADAAIARLDKIRHAAPVTSPRRTLRLEMQRSMQNNCAVFRTGEVLKKGVEKLDVVWGKRPGMGVQDKSMVWNSDLVETLELDNLMVQAVAPCIRRPTGWRAAAPMRARTIPTATTMNWMKHTVIWVDDDGKSRIDYRPVHMNPMTNEVQAFPPKARVY